MKDQRPLYVSPEDRALLRPLFERDEARALDPWELYVLGFMAGQEHTMKLVRQALREYKPRP